MYLSLGDLPVNFPVFTAKTLLFVKHPKFFFKQIEYNSSFVRLKLIFFELIPKFINELLIAFK